MLSLPEKRKTKEKRMSDTTDDQDTSNVSADTVEFATDPFSDSPDETTTTEPVTPANPAEDNAETTETKAEGDTPAEESTESPDGETQPTDQTEGTTEDKTDVDLKAMSRAERAEYFQQIQQQQKQQIEQSIDQAYQPQPVDELTDYYREQGYSDGEALMLARDDVRAQREQIAEARAEIAEFNTALIADAYDTIHRIDWLDDSKTDAFDKQSADLTAGLYEKLALEKDPRTGNTIGSKMSFKDFADAINTIRNSGTSTVQLAAQKAAEAQMAAVAPPTSTAPPSSSNNPDDKQASGLERALGNIR